MNLIKKIKILLKEAEIFHSQGLLDEAMGKYNEATELIKSDETPQVDRRDQPLPLEPCGGPQR